MMSSKENEDDPYIWLEDVESEASLTFAKESNAACLEALGDPTASATNTYDRILAVLESDDRIPAVSQYGHNSDTGEAVLYNFWKDARNPKGLWRQTTLAEYCNKEQPVWETVLDVDALAVQDNVSWVYKGNTPLPRARDDDNHNNNFNNNDHNNNNNNTTQVRRALLLLSRGGSDAVHTKEFDLVTRSFVTEHPFQLGEAKTRASYKSRNVLLVGSDFGPGTLTDSGYPRQVREWVRGTSIDSAPVVFEGAATDVSVGMYVSDERVWGGGIYEIQYRSLTFYTSKYWCRKIAPEHLLAPNDARRLAALADPEPPAFVAIDIPEDASISFLGQMAIISLRSDWEPKPGVKFQRGSVIVTHADHFLEQGAAGSSCEYTPLFEPTERTAYEYHTATKNYLILSTLDTVQSKLEFYKITENGTQLVRVDTESAVPQIRDCNCRPVDPYAGSDDFFFTTSDFTTPSTLFLADATMVETVRDQPDAFIKQQLKSLPPQYESSNLTVEQRMAKSKDGTEIPYFIVMPKDLVLDGTNPTLLYGNGGFEVSLGPHYIATSGLAWLERGGVYVEANIRGGGEFGPSWHQAALKANRNKAYEDFIAVAEDLIDRKICTSQTLAARGGSNVRFVRVHNIIFAWFGFLFR